MNAGTNNQLPANIQLSNCQHTKNKKDIIEDAINTLEEITTQKDKDAQEFLTPTQSQ